MKVVHINHAPYDIYIGRPSKWENPFKIGVDGTRSEVIKLYEEYVRNNKYLMESLPELEGKILGCWCYPKRCHGEVLIKLLDELGKYDLSSLE